VPPPPRRVSLTGRAAILGIVLLVLGISFAYPLRNWFAQRAEVAGLQAQIAEQQRSVKDLEHQIARWNDPAYVQAVARERLHFVLPGETLFVVLDDEEDDATTPQTEVLAEASGQWWQRLWTTVEQAGAAQPPPSAAPEDEGGG
jgi:cell division protein FtsB